MNYANLEGLQYKQSTKIQGHYEVSTKDFPINFSSIFNWYERGLCSYCDSKKKKLKQKTIKQTVHKL